MRNGGRGINNHGEKAMKQSEINLLTSFVKHCERVLTQSPPPSTRDTKTYNAYRIARYKELGKVKRIIETWTT